MSKIIHSDNPHDKRDYSIYRSCCFLSHNFLLTFHTSSTYLKLSKVISICISQYSLRSNQHDTYRRTTESNQGTFPLQFVSRKCNGVHDILQVLDCNNVLFQLLQIARLHKGFRERWTLEWNYELILMEISIIFNKVFKNMQHVFAKNYYKAIARGCTTMTTEQ